MQAAITISSTWQQLINREINCETALKLLVNEQGIVNLELLDKDVSSRFYREFPNRRALPPVIPLLLWRNCYYLGSPVALSLEDIKKLSDRAFCARCVSEAPPKEDRYLDIERFNSFNPIRLCY